MSAGPSGSSHQSLLEPFGLDASSVQRLVAYLDRLAQWNARVNLTGLATAEDRVRVLVAPILGALGSIQSGRLIDVGSGNGSPGLVLAAVRQDLEIVLLEPRLKRWAFLRDVARTMGRPGIDVRRERHDAYTGPPAETLTLRLIRLPLSDLARLVVPGGRVVVFGRRPDEAAGFAEEVAPAGVAAHVFRRCFT